MLTSIHPINTTVKRAPLAAKRLYFGGFDTFLKPVDTTKKTKHRDRKKPAYRVFSDNTIQDKLNETGKTERLHFSDDSFGIVKRIGGIYKEKGAYLFCSILGLDFIPKTELISFQKNIPNRHRSLKEFILRRPVTKPVVYSIQNGLTGHDLSKCRGEEHTHLTHWNKQNTIDMLGFMYVLSDADTHSGNVFYDTTQKRYYLIDNEMAGGCSKDTRTKVPPALMFLVEQKAPLSETFIKKIQHFVDNQTLYIKQLKPFFNKSELANIHQRAQQLLKTPYLSDALFSKHIY